MNKLAKIAEALVEIATPFNFYKVGDDFEIRIDDAAGHCIAYLVGDKNGEILEIGGYENTILEKLILKISKSA